MKADANFSLQIKAKTRIAVLLAALGLMTACAGNDEQQTEIENLQEAYEEAKLAINRNNYRRGIQIFEVIQARYPFSDLSRQIQLEFC